ncbi:HIT-like domain-containing protein [Entophlyctis helioformis]|nr:HIT-like domain-containing protein [Entophlyctis helioformis]
MGQMCPVAVDPRSSLRTEHGVQWVVYTVAPNVLPSRAECLAGEDAMDAAVEGVGVVFRSLVAWLSQWQPAQPVPALPSTPRSATAPNTPKRKAQDDSETRQQQPSRRSPWADALWPFCESPETFPKSVVESFDDETVTIYDKYPKSRVHMLVMPRRRIGSLADLCRDDVPLLGLMAQRAQEAIARHANGASTAFKTGFHAIPSMRQLHLHVLGTDHDAPALKTKHHYNSFTTPFFVPLEAVVQRLETDDRIDMDTAYYSALVKSTPMSCVHCGTVFTSMPSLKSHLKTHTASTRSDV